METPSSQSSFLSGPILSPLIRFALPLMLSLLLQAFYGGVDLAVVGKFSPTASVSAVATGSQVMQSITSIITGLTMGVTVFVGDCIGSGNREKAGQGVGTGIAIFAVLAVVVTALVVPFSDGLAAFMHAPAEAFAQTSGYVRICGMGTVFITAYNVLGAIFRGIGDSKTPLITAAIACVINIFGDLLLVAGFGLVMGTFAFFGGSMLASIFTSEGPVIAYAHSYLKAYAIDCLLTAILFCFVGYFNGCGKTVFVMVQGVVGAFCVRIPAVFLMSRMEGATLFHIGLGTPISSVAQILLCVLAYRYYQAKLPKHQAGKQAAR